MPNVPRKNITACILAGGKGTRLAALYPELPKPLIPVAGMSVAERQVRLLARHGITDIRFFTGHLAERIAAYFGDGRRWGVRCTYYPEQAPLGSAGCLSQLPEDMSGDLLILSGDVMLEMDLDRLLTFHQEKKAGLTLVAHPNNHPQDSDLVELGEDGRLLALHHKPHDPQSWLQNLVNASVFVLQANLVRLIPTDRFFPFEKDFIPLLQAQSVPVYGYATPEYIKDMGTPERLAAVAADIQTGKPEAFSRTQRRAAVFLDRDGTINRHCGFITRPEQLELIPGSAAAIRCLNQAGFLTVVITNQPVISRGETTVAGLRIIHNKLETLLGLDGAYLDAIYYCPHHPDKGFPGEIPELKIECDCRKPRIGLIRQAQQDFNIDLERAWFVGDQDRDEETAKNAKLPFYRVGAGHTLCDAVEKIIGNVAQSLSD